MPLITGDPVVADVRILAPLAYIVPSYVLYGILFQIIFIGQTRKQFSSSFYMIFGFSSVNNILYSLSYYLFYRVTNAPIFLPFLAAFPEKGFIITLIPYIMFNTMYIQNFLDLLLCFNRFTVLILKTRYQSFWQKHCAWMIVVCCLSFLPFTWQNWMNDGKILLINATAPEQGYRWDFYGKQIAWWRNSTNIAAVTLFCSVLALLMNLFVSYKLIQQKLSNFKGKRHEHKISSQDIKLFIFNIFIFFNQIANFVIQLLFFFIQTSEERTDMFRIQYWCVDINTLTPAWFLLITSKAIRKCTASMVLCRTINAIGEMVSQSGKKSITPVRVTPVQTVQIGSTHTNGTQSR